MLPEEWRRRLGQFFMISYDGVTVPDAIHRLIREENIGGVLLFGINCPTLKKTAETVRELQSAAENFPLFVAVDHEGGFVHRLPKPATRFPPMEALGKIYERLPSSTCAREVGLAMGRELRALGFHSGFAPVMDVHTNPSNPVIGDRSLSSNPEIVALAGCQLIDGLQSAGVAACAKHFPGHGDTNHDSHKSLPRLAHNLKRLESLELIPFEAAIQQGVASMMTAHVVYDGIDKNTPATFSVKILRDILRGELGFDGLLISDSLGMGAVTGQWRMEQAACLAFKSGCDFLILGKEPAEVPAVLQTFARAVESGEIPMERLESSWERLVHFKNRFVSTEARISAPPMSVIGSPAHRELANKIKNFS